MQWMDPDRLIEWVRSHWQQAGGFATTFMGYVSRSGFTVVTWVVNLALLPILANPTTCWGRSSAASSW